MSVEGPAKKPEDWVKTFNRAVSNATVSISNATVSSHSFVAAMDIAPPVEPVEEFWTPEPIMAYRGWHIKYDFSLRSSIPSIPSLRGAHGYTWYRGVQERAGDDRSLHPSPTWGCLCGYNAAKYLSDVSPVGYDILGRVALTGVVHEYQRGYRAMLAEIVELYTAFQIPDPERALLPIHLQYQVPIYQVDPYDPTNPRTRRCLYGNG